MAFWLRSCVSAIAVLTIIVQGLVGCGRANDSSTISPSNEPRTFTPKAKKKVITTFTILADMARNVAGDKLTVESITRIGAEIHGYEPTPSDLAKAQNADLILYNGMNLERWFKPFYQNLGDLPSVLLTEGIEPISISAGPYQNRPNPHAWMSPQNAMIYVENIRKAFVELDPQNADSFNQNAASYQQQLKAIDTSLKSHLQKLPTAQRYLVSCEGAFSYLARDYQLKEIYLWPINAEQQSTPKQIQKVIEQVKANAIPVVFCESTVSNKGQMQVVEETGAVYGGTLYVDSLSTNEGPVPTFLNLLTYDTRIITGGLVGKTVTPTNKTTH